MVEARRNGIETRPDSVRYAESGLSPTKAMGYELVTELGEDVPLYSNH